MRRYRMQNRQDFVEVPATKLGRKFLMELRRDDPQFRYCHIREVIQEWPLVIKAGVKYDLYICHPDAKVVCAWCREVIKEGPEPTSHGMCVMCAEEVQQDPQSKGLQG